MGYCLGTQVAHQDYNQDHLPTLGQRKGTEGPGEGQASERAEHGPELKAPPSTLALDLIGSIHFISWPEGLAR